MPLRVAIVGCGKIADGHVEEVHKLRPRADVAWVCDREPLLAEQLALRYGVPRHGHDFAALLAAARPDVVHITTPPQSHADLARQALAAGCHVYVEKPLGLTAAETRDVVAAAAAAGRQLTIGWFSYFDPPALELRRLLADGVLGDPVHVESWYGYDLGGPFGQALLSDGAHWVHRLPGKLLHNIIDHPLNKIAEFVTDDAPAIHADGWVRRAQRFGDARDDLFDELRVALRGARVSASAIFTSHVKPTMQFVRVYGTKNVAHVDYAQRSVTLAASARLPSAIGRVVPAFEEGVAHLRAGWRNAVRFAHNDFHFFAGLNELLRRFYDAIQTGAAAPIPMRDIIRVADWMDEIFRQVGQGKGRPA
jgi:predicted dehydrogenase